MGFLKKIISLFNGLIKLLQLIILLSIFGFIILAVSERGVPIPESAALILAPSGFIVEQLEGDPWERALAEVEGDGVRQTLVTDITDSLEAAIGDDRIKAVVLDLNRLEGGGLSKLQTISVAIDRVRESGKKVFAIGDGYTQAQYYLAAHADEIYLNELGIIMIDGFGYYRTYLRGALEKLKIDLNVFRVGKYKSFVEPFIRDDMSNEDKEASRRWLSVLWQTYQDDVEQARGLEAGSLEIYANEFLARLETTGGNTANVALEAGLVDHLAGRGAVRDELIELVGESGDDSGDFSGVHFEDYLADVRRRAGTNERALNVGVLVAAGEIVDGEAAPGTIGGDSLAALVSQAVMDESIKAVVLRVDSPGGSMFASEVVFAQLQRLKSVGKPLVVSMSTVAASGGYYIAMPADEIWASESTITGSIGVGALVPTIQRGLDTLGIHVDGIGTTRLSGQLRLDRELGDDARRLIQLSIEDAYRTFIGKVADQRDMSVERVDYLARGRVWVGSDALELGLVDQLGGLKQAIESAAERAGLAEGDYGVTYVEQALSLSEMLALEFAVTVRHVMNWIGLDPGRVNRTVLARIMSGIQRELNFFEKLNDPRGIYYHCFCELP
jgi:protease-4